MIATEASAFLLFDSILVKAFEGSGAPDGFSFDASGPEFTDLVDPVFGFFAGGGASSPSSSLKSKRVIIIGIKKISTEHSSKKQTLTRTSRPRRRTLLSAASGRLEEMTTELHQPRPGRQLLDSNRNHLSLRCRASLEP